MDWTGQQLLHWKRNGSQSYDWSLQGQTRIKIIHLPTDTFPCKNDIFIMIWYTYKVRGSENSKRINFNVLYFRQIYLINISKSLIEFSQVDGAVLWIYAPFSTTPSTVSPLTPTTPRLRDSPQKPLSHKSPNFSVIIQPGILWGCIIRK